MQKGKTLRTMVLGEFNTGEINTGEINTGEIITGEITTPKSTQVKSTQVKSTHQNSSQVKCFLLHACYASQILNFVILVRIVLNFLAQTFCKSLVLLIWLAAVHSVCLDRYKSLNGALHLKG